MTVNRWLFIGTDKRLSTCSSIMSERGHACIHVETDTVTKELVEIITDYAPQRIVFPILQLKGILPPELLGSGTHLYTGVATDEWISSFREAGLKVSSYLQDEQFIWRNARLTAEAFIAEFYFHTQRIITGEHFYIAGFGRVGKMVADVLASLGANVTIIARSEEQLSEALVLQYGTEKLTSTIDIKKGYLVNTVPSQWLPLTNTTKLHIFELASGSGCLRAPAAPEYYTILPGLPGIHFPIDAAVALADALERMYRR